MHLSGITCALSDSADALVELVLREKTTLGYRVSFDVNYRPALWSAAQARDRLRTLGRQADVVLVGLDEAQRLWGTHDANQVRELFPEPHSVVVKDGGNEAVESLVDHGALSTFRVPAQRVEVVEPVGAGDAFAAGYLASRLRGDGPQQRLSAGHRLAAWTLESTADFRPLVAASNGSPAGLTRAGAEQATS